MVDVETQALLRQLSDEAAQKAVDQTLLTLGIDKSQPIEVQRDLATLRELRNMMLDHEFQRDLAHLRRWRKAMDGVQSKGVMASMGFMIIGALGMVAYGLKIKFGFGG